MKTPEQRQLRRSGVFIINFDLVRVFLLLTLNMQLPAALSFGML